MGSEQGPRVVQGAWAMLALHAMVTALYVMPWYGAGYRMVVHLGSLVLLLGVLVACLVLVRHSVRARSVWPLVACLVATAALMAASVHRHEWRVAATDHWLQARHCAPTPHPPPTVLGGLKYVGGLSQGEIAYLNDTHCLGTRCAEELFVCPAGATSHPSP